MGLRVSTRHEHKVIIIIAKLILTIGPANQQYGIKFDQITASKS